MAGLKINLTPKELAERWGLSTATLANMRCKRIGPAWLKLGHHTVVYPLAAVERWERERLQGPLED